MGALATWMASPGSASAAPSGQRAVVSSALPLMQACAAKRCSDHYGQSCITQALHNETLCRTACNTAYCRGGPCTPSNAPMDIQCCQCLNACDLNVARERAACVAEYNCPAGCAC